MPTGSVKVHGLRELNRTFAKMGKQVQKETRDELKQVGEPVREAAQRMAEAAVTPGKRTPAWSEMRLGATTKLVYVAPKARPRGGSPRPTFAGLLLKRAMLPAVAQNEEQVVRGLEHMLDRLADREGF